MEIMAWFLALFFAGLSLYLGLRRPSPEPQKGLDGPRSATRSGDAGREDLGDQAVRGMARYLGTAVLGPLEEGLLNGELRRPAEDAVDALRDLAFYAQAAPAPPAAPENLVSVLQGVAREYTLQTGTPVRFAGSNDGVRVALAAERFKDALFLLLANAGHFSGNQTIEVTVQSGGEGAEVRIRDRGPGFGEEALLRAFEPFWTTESDALGLGLFQAKRLLEAQDAGVTVRNSSQGGGEAVVSLRVQRG